MRYKKNRRKADKLKEMERRERQMAQARLNDFQIRSGADRLWSIDPDELEDFKYELDVVETIKRLERHEICKQLIDYLGDPSDIQGSDSAATIYRFVRICKAAYAINPLPFLVAIENLYYEPVAINDADEIVIPF